MGLDGLSLYIKNSSMSSVLSYLSDQHVWGEQTKSKLQYSLKKVVRDVQGQKYGGL